MNQIISAWRAMGVGTGQEKNTAFVKRIEKI
jgi:hypothetical protein